MRSMRLASVTLAVLAIMTAGAFAQPAPAQAEDVLSHVPSNAIGFVVVNNLADTSARLDKFMADVGLKSFLPDSVLNLAKKELLLGAAVNDNGGVALVMLDPAEYGWDLKEMFSGQGPPDSMPPIAVLIPGSDPSNIFAAYEPETREGFIQFELGDIGPLYAKAVGGYTVVSPLTKVIDAIGATKADKSVRSKLGEHHAAVLAKRDIGVYVDMKMLAPAIQAAIANAMDSAEEDMEYAPEALQGLMAAYKSILPMYFQIFSQLDGYTLALGLTRTGIVVDYYASFKPDSMLGRLSASMKVTPGAMLDKLPALPYVLVAGGQATQSTDLAAAAEQEKMFEDMLTAISDSELFSELFSKLSVADKKRATDAMAILGKQVTGGQFYAGPSVPGHGVFGVACVLKVNDAKTAAGAIADLTDVLNTFVKSMLAENAEMVTIAYEKGIGTAGGVSADAITVTSPAFAEMGPDELDMMNKVLGEPRIAMYVATPDNKSLVVTFGGAAKFLGEVVKSAKLGGPLATDPDVAKALREMPENSSFVMLLNAANLLDAVKQGAAVLLPPGATMPPILQISMSTKIPIAIGSAPLGPGQLARFFIPTPLVAEGVLKYMEVRQKMAGEQEAESEDVRTTPEDEDF